MSKVYIIDVREKDEYDTGHMENAINIPVNLIFNHDIKTLEFLNTINKTEDTIKVYCASGGRAELAKTILLKIGFKDVINLGGFC